MKTEINYRVIITKYIGSMDDDHSFGYKEEVIQVSRYDSYNLAQRMMIERLQELGDRYSGRIEVFTVRKED